MKRERSFQRKLLPIILLLAAVPLFLFSILALVSLRGILVERALPSAGIPDRHRPIFVIDRARHHAAQFAEIRRTENFHARDRAQKSNIQHAVVGGTVRADNARAVYAEHHVQAFDRHIVHQLVVCPLQKGGIHREDGKHPPCR